jgi:hypothetical protein
MRPRGTLLADLNERGSQRGHPESRDASLVEQGLMLGGAVP